MSFDLIQPARSIIGILKFFGLWRLNNRWEPLYRAYSFLLHLFFTFLNTATMWASVLTAKDLEAFSESFYMSLTEAVFIVKFLNIVYFRREAMNFFELVESSELELRSADEKTIFRIAHRSFDVVRKFYIWASACVLAFLYTFVAFGSKRVLPYPAWMPFELNSGSFWYAFSFQLIGMIVTCLCNVSLDMLQSYYMHLLALIYQVIGYRLSKIGIDIGETSNEVDANRAVMAELTEIVKMHQFAKGLTKKCERLTSVPFFMQVLLSGLVLCFTGYQLQDTSPLDKPGQFIGTADFLFVLGLQIFLPCYYANKVTIQSGKLSQALYNSNWVVLPQKSRKLICLYMEFLRDPVCIRAGVFFNIGVPIFAKTLNNAYSYFALLIRMKN